MYKILIKYDNDKFNLWMPFGSTITSTTGESEFTEFETDDVTVLKETILKLDKEYGFEKIRVIEDVTVNFSVDVVVDENTESTEGITENNQSTSATTDENINNGEQPPLLSYLGVKFGGEIKLLHDYHMWFKSTRIHFTCHMTSMEIDFAGKGEEWANEMFKLVEIVGYEVYETRSV